MKKKSWLWFALVVLILLVGLSAQSPRLRTELFVRLHHEILEENAASGLKIPASDALLFGCKAVNDWAGEHPMREFIILTRGDTYYGCYYSPDDTPLSFQNADEVLTQEGHNRWEWKGAGDNYGVTSRIMEHWYYFEASL